MAEFAAGGKRMAGVDHGAYGPQSVEAQRRAARHNSLEPDVFLLGTQNAFPLQMRIFKGSYLLATAAICLAAVAATPPAAEANPRKPGTRVVIRVRPGAPARPDVSGFNAPVQVARPRYEARIADSHYSKRDMGMTVFEIGGPDQAEAAREFVKMLACCNYPPLVTKLDNGRTQVIVPGHVDSGVYFAFLKLIQSRLIEDKWFGESKLGAPPEVNSSSKPRKAFGLTKTVAATRLQLKSFVDRLFGAKPSLLPPGYKEADFVPSSLY